MTDSAHLDHADDDSTLDRWLEIKPTTSLIPIARKNAASTVVGRKMFIFGGLAAGRSQTLNVFDFESMAWSEFSRPEQFHNSHMPCPRSGHTAVAVGSDMYVFGGEGDPHHSLTESKKTKGGEGNRVRTISKRVDLGDLWKLDTEEMYWEETEMKGRKTPKVSTGGTGRPGKTSSDPIIPCARRGHSATFVPERRTAYGSRQSSRMSSRGGGSRGQMWVFGGAGPDPTHGIECTFSDLWVLDFDTMIWEMQHVTGGKLPPRWGHSATLEESSRTLFIIGGEGPAGASEAQLTKPFRKGYAKPPPVTPSTKTRNAAGMIGSHVVTVNVDTLVMSHMSIDMHFGDPGWLMGHSAMANPHRPGYIYIFGGRQLSQNGVSGFTPIEEQAKIQQQREREGKHHHHHHHGQHRRSSLKPPPPPVDASGGWIFALNTMGKAGYAEMERIDHEQKENGVLHPQRRNIGPSPPCWEIRPIKSEVRVTVIENSSPKVKSKKHRHGKQAEVEPPQIIEEVVGPPPPRYCHCHEAVGVEGALLFGGLFPPNHRTSPQKADVRVKETSSLGETTPGLEASAALVEELNSVNEQDYLERKVLELERKLQEQEKAKQAKQEKKQSVGYGHMTNKLHFFQLGHKPMKKDNLEDEMLKDLRAKAVNPVVKTVQAAPMNHTQLLQQGVKPNKFTLSPNRDMTKPYHREEGSLSQEILAFGSGTTTGGSWGVGKHKLSTLDPKSRMVQRQEAEERKKVVRKMLTSHSKFLEKRMHKTLQQQRHAMEEHMMEKTVGVNENVEFMDSGYSDGSLSDSSSDDEGSSGYQAARSAYGGRIPDDIIKAQRQTRAYTPHTKERAKARARGMPTEYSQWKAQITKPLAVKSQLDPKYRQFPKMPNPTFREICPELFSRGGASSGNPSNSNSNRNYKGMQVSQSMDSFLKRQQGGGGSLRDVLSSARATTRQPKVNTQPFHPPSLPRLPLGVPVPYKEYGKMKIDRKAIDLHIDSAATLLQ